ncbi:MAG: diguanylate cyclase [Casimicrobiaceae bacterium]
MLCYTRHIDETQFGRVSGCRPLATRGRPGASTMTGKTEPSLQSHLDGVERFARSGHAAEGLIGLMALMPETEAAEDAALKARLWLLRGTFERFAGRLSEARESLQRAASLFTLCSDSTGYAEAMHQFASVGVDAGAFDEAVDATLDGLSVLARRQAPLVRSRLLRSLGTALTFAHDFEHAEYLLREAVELARASGDEGAEAHPLYRLAQISIEQEELYRVFASTGPEDAFFDALEAAGAHHTLQSDPARLDRAQRELEEAYALAERSGRERVTAMCLVERSRVAAMRGALDEAVNHACRAITTFRALPFPRGEGDALQALGHAYLAGCNIEEARHSATMSLQLALSTGLRPLARDAHLLLARCHEIAGEPALALLHYKRARRLELMLRASEISRRCQRLQLQQALEESRIERERLASAAKSYEQQALTDPLTGLHNRRGFEQCYLEAQAARASVALLVIDVDHFKQINDLYGHALGDRVLARVAATLARKRRSTDCLGRWGGEEFVVLLHNVTSATASERAELIRREIEATEWSDLAPTLRVTISLGVAATEAPASLEVLFARADQALYAAKAQGRNRVVLAREDSLQAETVPSAQNDATSSR